MEHSDNDEKLLANYTVTANDTVCCAFSSSSSNNNNNGRRISSVSGEDREAAFLFQRISVNIQRTSARFFC